MTRKYIIIYLVVMAISTMAIMQSCKTKKHVLSSTPIENKLSEDLFVDIINNQFDYTSLSSKLNLNLSSGKKSLSSKSNIKIIKDKAIQLSVQPLFGVEMLRLYMDTDTLVILDRMNKRYIKESIKDIKEVYPVGFDFTTLQSLLTNRVFVSGNRRVSQNDFKNFTINNISDQYYLIRSTDKKSGIEYSFAINGNDHLAGTFLREPRENYELEWAYDEFIKSSQSVFPHKMNISIASPDKKANVRLEFSGLTLNDNFDLSISIPNGYTRAYISDIIKILKSN